MNKLKKYFLMVILSLQAIPAVAEIDCTQFNTHKFFENISHTLLEKCSSLNSGQINFIKDDAGSIPFFKALASENNENIIDIILSSIDEKDLDKFFSITDNDGRNAFTIASVDAPYLTYLVRLISFYNNHYNNNDILNETLDGLIGSELDNDVISILKINGAIHSEKIHKGYSDQIALLSPKVWSDINFSSFKIQQQEAMPLDGWQENEQKCPNLFDKEFLKNIDTIKYLSCDKTGLSNYLDKDGSSFLHLLAKYSSNSKVLDLYLGSLTAEYRNEVISRKDQNNLKAIHIAAKYSENPSIISRLVAWGADINATVHGNTKFSIGGFVKRNWKTRPIHMASSRSDDMSYKILVRILAHGADAYAQDETGNTALHLLVLKDNVENFELEILLQAQLANLYFSSFREKVLEPKNKSGATPLALAVSIKNGDLGEADNDINIQHHWIISELLTFGADPDQTDDENWTPLLLYSANGKDADTFDLLLNSSSKPCKTQNKSGLNIVSALKQNTHLKDTEISGVGLVKFPMGLFRKRCPS